MQINVSMEPITKRSILSNVSQIFDPLGLLSPVIIVAKVLLQQLWLLKIGWDDTVPDHIARVWNRFVNSLQALDTIRIPRHVIGVQRMYIELHVFSDASQTAYGACIYIRTVSIDSTVSVRLLISKTKVAPLKTLSIPRLELCGALLGARLYNKVRAKWTVNKDELKPNSLVVIKDNNLPPLKWRLGRVVRTIPGSDGISRVADIRTAAGVVRRTFSKICPLFQDVDETQEH
uniref:DUF5641 domain-containing protein n=2 Tax=Bombyx mori TaxID=7091 RepID=A0A8R2M1M8_BOMMO|nr:uncharacterized protein LOC119629588 isoform X2 [Bombyx mori]